MKRLICLLLLVLSVTSFARLRSVKITASGGSPIPTSYDISDSQSAAVVCEAARHLMVLNETSARIAMMAIVSTSSPSDTSKDQLYVIGGAAAAWDFLPIATGATVFLRSDSGAAITTGTVEIMCW